MDATNYRNERKLSAATLLYFVLFAVSVLLPPQRIGLAASSESISPEKSSISVHSSSTENGRQQMSATEKVKLRVEQVLHGLASYYGPNFHGRATANGEVFDQYQLTAAHPSLPFGTFVRVKNLMNGRIVRLRINDRGPYITGRSLDVSVAAAKLLGFLDEGVVPVEMTVLSSR